MFQFYESTLSENDIEYPLRFVVINHKDIGLAVFNEEYNEYTEFYSICDEKLIRLNVTTIKKIEPAKRDDIQKAGLWNYVRNKDDYSCIEDELEEYFEIGRNLG